MNIQLAYVFLTLVGLATSAVSADMMEINSQYPRRSRSGKLTLGAGLALTLTGVTLLTSFIPGVAVAAIVFAVVMMVSE